MIGIQMLLMLLAASWMCCDAVDQTSRLYVDLLNYYVKDVKPPLPEGASNTTVKFSLTLFCATPVGDFVSIESWIAMVSIGLTSFNDLMQCLGGW